MNKQSPRWPVQPTPKLRLVCFPYAGGSSTIFSEWSDLLGDDYEVTAVTLPGRGVRIGERPHETWSSLLRDIQNQISSLLDAPYALFGHSFGGRIAYEVSQIVGNSTPPIATLISGCRSPDFPQNQPLMHLLSDEEFLTAVDVMEGTPKAILDNQDVMRIMLPTIRSDMKLSETWTQRHSVKIDTPIHVLLGSEDKIETPKSVEGWEQCTASNYGFHEMSGGHFNIDENPRAFIRVLKKILEEQYAKH